MAGCRHGGQAAPPPDARRPVLKTQAELAAQREERVRAGRVVPTTAPARLAAEGPVPEKRTLPTPIRTAPGAIEAEILLVNDSVVTLPEVLYPLRERLAEARQTRTREGFAEAARRMLEVRTQQDIGAVLIHGEAMAGLSDPQHAVVEDGVERQVQARISHDFGGSKARFENHLAEHGLITEQYRTQLEREMVARQYTREKLLPRISVRRDELMAYYRENLDSFSSAETRELWLIEAPFEAFLPAGASWARASAGARAQARFRAARHIRAAHQALAEKPFEEVARSESKGVHAAQGGAWGEIGRPLQPPYDQVSALIFEFSEGQYSDPVETDSGWYVVKCGRITPARRVSFIEAQEEIRQKLIEQKFERLSAEYMVELAEKATVSGLDSFLRAGLRRIAEEQATGAALNRE